MCREGLHRGDRETYDASVLQTWVLITLGLSVVFQGVTSLRSG